MRRAARTASMSAPSGIPSSSWPMWWVALFPPPLDRSPGRTCPHGPTRHLRARHVCSGCLVWTWTTMWSFCAGCLAMSPAALTATGVPLRPATMRTITWPIMLPSSQTACIFTRRRTPARACATTQSIQPWSQATIACHRRRHGRGLVLVPARSPRHRAATTMEQFLPSSAPLIPHARRR